MNDSQIKSCPNCNKTFQITPEDLAFYEKISPIFNGEKFLISSPTLCPDCRETRRLAFRNDRYYYSRTCDLCIKPILSLFKPSYTDKVFCNICWWSDKWDPLAHGREFDFSRPFFDQFKELLKASPRITMINDNGFQSVNCEYTNDLSLSKNAYNVLSSWYTEDCMYGFQINWVKNCVDNTYLLRSELMYETIMCENSYNCAYCHQVKECADCVFGYDLQNCTDCLLCAGLRNKKYCILNRQYSREDYLKFKENFNLSSYASIENLKKQFDDFLLKIPRKYANLISCENTTGDNLKRCKDSYDCYNQAELHSCKFMTSGDKATDCYDCTSTGNPELCYEALTPDNGYANAFIADCWNAKYVLYSIECHNSNNLFGCTGLKKNSYCILNKQYSREEYEKLVPRIIKHMQNTGEWGEFFPPILTPFNYDETAANEWHKMDEETAEKLGYGWSGETLGSFGKETCTWDKMPDQIENTLDTAKEIFACTVCQKNYKIIKEEFDFYKKQKIPLPRLCPNCRHLNRKAKLNPKTLYLRTCASCPQKFQTTYAPDRPETVLCEECYLKTVY